MIGVFLLQRVIAVIKRVTAISDLLKPATWEKIAIAHGLVGLSFLFVYGFLDHRVQETDIPPVAIAQLVSAPLPVAQRVPVGPSTTLRIASITLVTPHRAQSFSMVVIDDWDFFAGTHNHWSRHGVALSSIGDFAPGGWKLPSIGAQERHVVLQREWPGGQSLLETVLKLLALFQGVTMMINGSVASILGLIAYHRNKVDMAVKHLDLELKRLQILQIREALDTQARVRLKEAEEAARSSIILIS